MNAKRAVLAVAAIALASVGCTLTQTGLRQEAEEVGKGGRLVTPKRHRLDVVILTRPQGDPVLNEVLWRAADEMAVDDDARRAWQANGMRIGRIVGDLPPEVAELLRAAPPNRPDVQTIVNPSGTSAMIDPVHAPARPDLNLLLSHPDGSIKGKVYHDARAFLRLTPNHDDTRGVALKLVPELHHGPVVQGFGVIPSDGMPVPQEFRITNGQKEETFRDLAATIDLQPGQTAVLGARPERPGSLGDVLFQKLDGNSDRILQSVVLLQASRVDPLPGDGESSALPPGLIPVDPKDLDLSPGSASPKTPELK